MGTPLLVDAWERPATTSVIIVCCLVWYYLHRHGLGYEDVGVSYRKAVVEGQYWRCITASFSHVSLIHLLFNMSSLWSLGVVEKMGRLNSKGDTEWGTACYVRYTVVMLIGTMAVVLGVTHLLIKHFKLERYEHVRTAGYSCVVFGWMTVLSVKNPTPVFSVGPVGSNISLPVNLAPFGSLIFTSIVVPQASFVGHLSGIFVGYLIAWDLFKWVNNGWCGVLVFCVTVGLLWTLKATTTVTVGVQLPGIELVSKRMGGFFASGESNFTGTGRRLGGDAGAATWTPHGTSRLLASEGNV